ncbi:MAG: NusA-like transcription termination signal-binding factor [Candidatus Hadarchaeum sp.]|uniref:NusA-like transcription termination signal-binding factor n=1 Tax=Candidatus Hadarchaeum sp. TaxID=2883567 RepID=UPI00318122DA
MTIKFTAEEMRYIASFEGLTGARVRDCIINDFGGNVTFVVNKGDFGMAVGRGGDKVKRARRLIGRGIEVIEYSEDPVEFLKNALLPARVQSVKIVEKGEKKVALVSVELQDKGLAVGRGGKKIQIAKKLAERHHGISDVILI